ncbi:MAG TPA: hypothetical protein VMV78_06070 [Thiobacillus sp.]|nr:hypothetical protein [Thiobacillus sp.]
MPLIDSAVLATFSSIAAVLVQLLKGMVDDAYHRWIPLAMFVVMTPLGVALAMYMGRDPVAGALEGFFGFAGAVGFYQAAKAVAPSVVNGKGWIGGSDAS